MHCRWCFEETERKCRVLLLQQKIHNNHGKSDYFYHYHYQIQRIPVIIHCILLLYSLLLSRELIVFPQPAFTKAGSLLPKWQNVIKQPCNPTLPSSRMKWRHDVILCNAILTLGNRLKDVSVLHKRSCRSVSRVNACRWIWEPFVVKRFRVVNSSWLPFIGSWHYHVHVMLNSFPLTNHIKDGTCTRGVANQVIAWWNEPITVWHVRMYAYSTPILTVT